MTIPVYKVIREGVAGVVQAITQMELLILLAYIMFYGTLQSAFLPGVGLLLISFSVPTLIIGLSGSIPGIRGVPSYKIYAVLAVLTMSTASLLEATPDRLVPTVMMAIFITTLLTGISLILLGQFKLGNVIRFFPYPVICGYFAGSALVLLKVGIKVLTGISIKPAKLMYLLQFKALIMLGAGILLGLVFFFVRRRVRYPILIPLFSLVAVGVFYLALHFFGISVFHARELGLLMPAAGQHGVMPGVVWLNLALVDWSVIREQIGLIGFLVFISCLHTLIQISDMEVAVEQDAELDLDLKTTGIACVVSGILGGSICSPDAHLTEDSVERYGSRSRWGSVAFSLVFLVFFLIGPQWITFYPKLILGGMAFAAGFQVLYEWIYEAYFKMSHSDYAVILLIVVCMMGIGFLQGIVVGLVLAIGLFVIQYSQLNLIKYEFTCAQHTSKVSRSASFANLLHQHGEEILVLVLHGYVFFGSMEGLFRSIRKRLKVDHPPRWLILDFHHIPDMDHAAAHHFLEFLSVCAQGQTTLVLTGFNLKIHQLFQGAGLSEKVGGHYFSELEFGLEWCENQLLERLAGFQPGHSLSSRGLERVIANPDFQVRFSTYLKRRVLHAGEVLFHRHASSDSVYFVDSGKVSVYLNYRAGQPRMRLRTFGRGGIVGEMGLYTAQKRSATAIAEDETVVYELTRDGFNAMQQQDPKLSAGLHQFVVRSLTRNIADHNHSAYQLLTI